MHLIFRSILIYYPHPSTFDTDTRRRTVLTADFLAVAARDQHFNPTKAGKNPRFLPLLFQMPTEDILAPLIAEEEASTHYMFGLAVVLAFKCPADPYLILVPVSLCGRGPQRQILS